MQRLSTAPVSDHRSSNGRVVGTVPAGEASRGRLVEMMVGHQVAAEEPPAKGVDGASRLVVKDLRVESDRGAEAVRGISFEVHSGELVGIAGVAGNGQRELCLLYTSPSPRD